MFIIPLSVYLVKWSVYVVSLEKGPVMLFLKYLNIASFISFYYTVLNQGQLTSSMQTSVLMVFFHHRCSQRLYDRGDHRPIWNHINMCLITWLTQHDLFMALKGHWMSPIRSHWKSFPCSLVLPQSNYISPRLSGSVVVVVVITVVDPA